MAYDSRHETFVTIVDPVEHAVLPDPRAWTIDIRGERRYQCEAEDQRAEKCKANGHGHRREEPPLDALEREQRDISRDDNHQREKDRALDVPRRRAHNL